jgi:hypothetical protein
MAKKKEPVVSEFVDAFVTLPREHRVTIVAALRLYTQIMQMEVGSATFSRNDVMRMRVSKTPDSPLCFAEIGLGSLEPEKSGDLADHLSRFLDVNEKEYHVRS